MSESNLDTESGKTSNEGLRAEADESPRDGDPSPLPPSGDNVMYDVEIDSVEDRSLSGDEDVHLGEDVENGGGSQIEEAAEEPENDVMCAKEDATTEEYPRSPDVTSNGDLDGSPEEDVFGEDSSSGGLAVTDLRLPSSNYAPTSEVVIQSEASQRQPVSGALVLSEDVKSPTMEKLDLVRKWSINTYKCTRQILSERLGRGSKTVDLDLEARIEVLRDNKRKYQHLIKLAQTLAAQLAPVLRTQKQLGDAFADLSLKTPELHEEFAFNAETQKLLSKNGETLLSAINFFIDSVNTLVDKTIEDTIINIKQYELARVEYDAYRTDLEELNLGPRDATTLPKIELAQQHYQTHRDKYQKMRDDVSVKLKFLEENKVKVLHKQLMLFHNAVAAYYSGNQQQLEQTLQQFHIKLKAGGAQRPSWLEEH
ncbi:arfaptin-1 [Corythoichthys intestinalis]|uniref:arfaptin-1 n=1 Tax=Corythoichthys intestinalis TaxID=161448 RepID=UPI0025A672E3|nr:arfaptin-1-like [Corythoichthys intestinalis]XP_061792126.1 arfaptin-1-like [Nerophis lumbriciformis]